MSLQEKCKIIEFDDLGYEGGRLVGIEGGQASTFDIQRGFYSNG